MRTRWVVPAVVVFCVAAASAGPLSANRGLPASAMRTPAVAAPYGLDQRPAPDAFDPNVLLPTSVGPFLRSPLPDGTLNQYEDISVTYQDERGRIDIGFSMNESDVLARHAVRSARVYARRLAGAVNPCQESLDSEPSFVKAPDYIAWSRGRFFFYAKATDGATLDRFMERFPF